MTTAAKLQLELKNILVKTDFSEASASALAYAIELGRQHSAKILVIHAIEPEPFAGVPLDPLHDNYKELLDAEKTMSRFADKNLFGGLQHQEFVRKGHIWDAVRTAAKENNVDLIVLATQGRTGIKHLFMGSVAEQVFRNAYCPVITIGPNATAQGHGQIRNVLYATDYSESAERALPYAVALAHESGATLTALHVADFVYGEGVDYSPQMLLDTERHLREKVRPPEGVPNLRYLARLGVPADGILTTAAEQGADLIVMGLHRHSAMATHLPWATAHQVVARAICPVLTVH